MKFVQTISPAGLFLFLGAGTLICTQQVYAQHEQEEKQAKPERQPAKAPPQQRAQPQERAQQPPQHAQPQEHAQQPQEHVQQPRQQVHTQPEQKAQPAARQPQAQRTQTQPHALPAAATRNSTSPQRSYAPPQRSRQEAQSWQQRSTWQQNGAWQEHASWQQDRSSNWQADHRTWEQRGGYGGYFIPQASFGLYFGTGHSFRLQREPVIVGGYPRFQYGGYAFMMVDPYPESWPVDWYASNDVYVGYDNGYYLYNRAFPGPGIAISVVL